MNKYSVGVIGCGFVGEGQAFSFSPISNVKIYDIDHKKANSSLDEALNCKLYCSVPTPMKKDGSQDLSFINDVFENAKNGPIYIKSQLFLEQQIS